MTIIKRGNSYWIDIGFNSQRFRKRSPENSYRGAKAYELLIRQKLSRGEPINEPRKVKMLEKTFKDFSEEFFNSYVKINNKLSEARSKRSALNVYLIPFFGKLKLSEITSYDVEKFKAERQKQGLSNKYINNLLCVLSKCLRTAEDWGILDKPPKIKHLKVAPQKFDFLSIEESEVLLKHAQGFLKDMILFALQTGLRFGEIIAVTWKDINFNENVLTVSKSVSRGYLGSTKSNKIRYIPLSNDLVQMLEFRKLDESKNELVFPNTVGKYLIQERCRKWLHQICKKADLRIIGWHTFRHTFASRLAENGISMRTIQELLGHADTNTTMRYAHLSPLILREAIKTLERPITWHNSDTTKNRVLEFEPCLAPHYQNSLEKNKKLDVNLVS
jgi:integrase